MQLIQIFQAKAGATQYFLPKQAANDNLQQPDGAHHQLLHMAQYDHHQRLQKREYHLNKQQQNDLYLHEALRMIPMEIRNRGTGRKFLLDNRLMSI